MKSLTLLLMLATFASTAQPASEYLQREFVSAGATLPYRILFPDGYDRSEKYPLILVLHGAGERGSDNVKQLTHGSTLFLDSAVRKNFPAIVVFPQCPEENYWSSVSIDREQVPLALQFDYRRDITLPLKQAVALVDQLIADEGVDTKRVYITGLSMGGMGTFEAVHRFPKRFAAALPICGGGDTQRYRKVKTPFWVFHGDKDAVVDVGYSREMVEKLKELKVDVRYTEYPGVNHNSWDSAFAEPDFLKWMFSHKR